MLVDTDVLIWYLKGNESAYQFIENLSNFNELIGTLISF